MKILHNILCLIVLLLVATSTFAQAKEEKQITIVTKTIDENGKEVTEEITLTGDEVDEYMKQNGMKVTEKMTKGQKEIEVEITNDGSTEKEVNVWISDDGTEHKMEGDKEIHFFEEGEEISEEVREMLKEKGIDIDELVKEAEDKEGYKIITIDDEGNEKNIEWDGEGEMPAEMKKVMDEIGIDQNMKSKRIEIEQDININVEEIESEEGKTIKIKKIKNGEEEIQVIKLEKGEEMPTEVLDILKENGIDPDDLPTDGKTRIEIKKDIKGEPGEEKVEKVIKVMDKERSNFNKAQMGVMIEAHGTGVKVNQVLAGSAAEMAGLAVNDVITFINKEQVTDIDSLLNILSKYEGGDKVKVSFIRGGKVMKKKLTLKSAK